MPSPPLCILSAGKGKRLGAFTESINKALLNINNKAVISHIIEKVPVDTEIIVAIGYQGDKIKDYCFMSHPDRNFTFVQVLNYDGVNSGPGESLKYCYNYLQRPFYLSVVDCLVDENLPELDRDWVAVYQTNDFSSFATVSIGDNNLVDGFYNKNHCKKENLDKCYSFIGLAGIKSYDLFWKHLLNSKPIDSEETELITAFYNFSEYPLYAYKMNWHDTGTIESYFQTKKKFEGEDSFNFNKTGEFTYILNNRVVKYFDDVKKIDRRLNRSYLIEKSPRILSRTNSFFCYEFQEGKTLYDSINEFEPGDIVHWLNEYLWNTKNNKVLSFSDSCLKFYKWKTLERYEDYKNRKNKILGKDVESLINGKKCKPIEYYLDLIDWNWLSEGIPVIFHGDLHYDNIIKTKDEYVLIDWRDCFADQLIFGDLYYDFAKFYGGFNLPYNIIKKNYFYYNKESDNSFQFSYKVDEKLNIHKEYFVKWIVDNGYDLKKVKTITALIYLNMSPLHEYPFDDLLFCLSKYKFMELEEQK